MNPDPTAGPSGDRIESALPRLEELEQSLRKTLEALRASKPEQRPGAAEPSVLSGESFPSLAEIKSLREAARSPEDWRALTERLSDLTKALGPEWVARGNLASHVIRERDLGVSVQGIAFAGRDPLVLAGDRSSQPSLWSVFSDSSDPLNLSGVSSVAFSAEGKLAALVHLGSDSCKVLSLDASGRRELGSVPLERLGSTNIAFSPGGQFLAVISENSWRAKIHLYSIPEIAKVASVELASEHTSVGPLAISFEGDRLAFAYSLRSPQEAHRLRVVSLEHLAERNGRPKVLYDATRETASALIYTPDGKLLSCDVSGAVNLGSQKAGASKPVLSRKELSETFEWEGFADLGGTASLIAVSASGKTIAIATSDSFVRIFDTTERWEDGSPAIAGYYQFPHDRNSSDRITALAISEDGKTIAVGDSSGKVRVLGSQPA